MRSVPESCTSASCAPCTVNLLGAVTNGSPVKRAISAAAASAKPGCGVDAGADRRAAQRQPIDALQRIVEALQVVGEHAGIARPFLAERDRRRVLHVGAADLDDVVPGLGLGGDRVAQRRRPPAPAAR